MEITFDDYVKNPTGGRSHMVGERDAAKAVYTDKFNKIMMKTAGAFRWWIYADPPSRYVLYIKIPSESVTGLFYDVVIEFYTKDVVEKNFNRLDKYYVKFFSNDPNFVFTYAYTFKKNGLLIKELSSKISESALKEAPKKTNPTTSVGYVKSLYFAYLFWKMKGLNNKLAWIGAPKVNFSSFSGLISPSDRKLEQARQMKTIQSATKKGSMSFSDPDHVDLSLATAQAKNRNISRRVQDKIYAGNTKRSAYSHRTNTSHIISRRKRK